MENEDRDQGMLAHRADGNPNPVEQAEVPSADKFTCEFPEWNWRTSEQLRARLPLLLFLKYHDRGSKTTTGDCYSIRLRVAKWLKDDPRFNSIVFDASVKQMSTHLQAIAKDEHHSSTFGVKCRQGKRVMNFDIVAHSWKNFLLPILRTLPVGWLLSTRGDKSLVLSTCKKGGNVKVEIGEQDKAGKGEVLLIEYNGHCLKNAHGLDWPSHIKDPEDLTKLLHDIEALQPCLGVSEEHLDEGAKEGFPSVVRAAERHLQSGGCFPFEGSLGWARGVELKGYLSGRRGAVSGVLGAVAGRRVFWSSKCTGVASSGRGEQTYARCQGCRDFHRDTLLKRAYTATRLDPHPKTNNCLLSTAQKTRKLAAQHEVMKQLRDKNQLLMKQLEKSRSESFLESNASKGEAMHDFLSDKETRGMFRKYPKGSVQRAVYEDQVKWNTTHGTAKGFRFHPETLRLAVYFQGIAGSAAYNVISEVLHLPSPSRIKQIRRKATPTKSGLQVDNIKKYGQIAAAEGVDKADLIGLLAWDLMHLNKNGFKFSPNGAGISGLCDPEHFFNPVYASQPGGGGDGLEATLVNVVATQYVEAFFVSVGNPKYKFVVWREAVRSLNTDYIARMVTSVSRDLASAHADKGFDVIATVCDGAAEHRSFQQHAATVPFAQWAREGEEEFSDFNVGFLHSFHQHVVFNMSDPVHLVKKVVNALWHSDMPDKQRALGMYRVNTKTGSTEFRHFSLKSAERVYNKLEEHGDDATLEEHAATLRTFHHLTPAMFRRTSHTCMNVSLSVKVVSGTMIKAIQTYQEAQDEPDGGLENYELLAYHMNDLVDIFNGNYTRTKFERRKGINKMKGCITSVDSPHLERLMDILAFFSQWEQELKDNPPAGPDWQQHFITRQSWFDMRVCILGFVATCRYLLQTPDTYKHDRASPRTWRFINPRTFSQDIIEQRFAHIRQGLGSTRNPTKDAAYRCSKNGDNIRGINNKKRRNPSHNVRRGSDFDLSSISPQTVLPVTQAEREQTVRSTDSNTSVEIICPRVVKRKG